MCYIWYDMLRYVVLRCAVLCRVMLRYAVLVCARESVVTFQSPMMTMSNRCSYQQTMMGRGPVSCHAGWLHCVSVSCLLVVTRSYFIFFEVILSFPSTDVYSLKSANSLSILNYDWLWYYMTVTFTCSSFIFLGIGLHKLSLHLVFDIKPAT